MNVIRKSPKVIMWLFVLMICFTGCKSKKKAAEAARAAEERARMEQEAARADEERKRQEAEEAARREAEERERMANAPKTRLNQYFESIARSNNVASANASINEALTLFASPDTPVLIVISEENGQKDYDRPTTIRQYLNYLKDTKNNSNRISDLRTDASGKITEVELRKTY